MFKSTRLIVNVFESKQFIALFPSPTRTAFKWKRLIEGVQMDTVDRSSTKTNRKEDQRQIAQPQQQKWTCKNKLHISKAKEDHTMPSKRKEAQKRWKEIKKQEGQKRKQKAKWPGRNRNEQCRWGTFQVVSNAWITPPLFSLAIMYSSNQSTHLHSHPNPHPHPHPGKRINAHNMRTNIRCTHKQAHTHRHTLCTRKWGCAFITSTTR